MTAQVTPIRSSAEPAVEATIAIAPVDLAQVSSRYRLLTVKEAAALLGKSEAQLRWMMHNRTAPLSALIGGRRVFRLSDIEAHIDAAFEAAAREDASG